MQILVLIVAMLAVSRLSMLFVDDRLLLSVRRFVVNRWGEDSLAAYWIHCNWCLSMAWAILVMPPAILWPNRWVLAILSIPAASLVAGFLSKLRDLGSGGN